MERRHEADATDLGHESALQGRDIPGSRTVAGAGLRGAMGLVRLCIPEVVVREHVSHYREDVAKAAQERLGSARRLDRLRPPDLRDPDSAVVRSSNRQVAPYVEEWTRSYERWLRDFIDEHGEVLPLPAIGHDELLDALFSARKPFAKSEKGYKDALIWWTVVEALDGDGWVFTTDNTSDFLTGDGSALADDLLADLRKRSKDPLHLGVRTTLDQLVAELIPRDTPAEDQFLAFARSSAGSERLVELIDGQRFPLQDPAGLMPAWPKWIEATGELEDPQFIRADARPVEAAAFSCLQLSSPCPTSLVDWRRISRPIPVLGGLFGMTGAKA